MKYRRKGREFALQSLYALELGQGSLPDFKHKIISGLGVNPEGVDYGMQLVRLVLDKVFKIDDKISRLAENWSFDRIAVIDRLLLRCSIAEMLYIDDVPLKVSITEAIQLARKYSTHESANFINGILDKLAGELNY